MINKALSWYRDVVDYVGDEEELDNDHTFVRSLAEIQSPYSQHHNTLIHRHRKSALVYSPITLSPWSIETTPLI